MADLSHLPSNSHQRAVFLHGPRDLRLTEHRHPGEPGPGNVLLEVLATGICGSDLHPYETGSIGSTQLSRPLILGHEFSGVVRQLGPGVTQLEEGTRVAVDPAWVCGSCTECRNGNPNLCRRQRFCGLAPYDGSLQQWMVVPAGHCHAVPDEVSDEAAALLEPLGIALHATDLARIRVGSSVAILGAGPIGLGLVQTARLAGASMVYVAEPLAWRMDLAQRLGAGPLPAGVEVDVVIEAAWAKESVAQAMELARPGGTVVLVGIPYEDTVSFAHSVARRKGLTILMSRRMKHVYARALRLVQTGAVDMECMITHRVGLSECVEAFRMNAAYEQNVIKVMVRNQQ